MSQAQDPPEVSALWAAVERGDVTFHQVSTAWFESRFASGDPSRNGRPDDATRRPTRASSPSCSRCSASSVVA